MSIWRPSDHQSGFFPLGDFVHASHGYPDAVTVTVSERTPGALAPPLSLTEIWRDSGSGADMDVRVFQMNPVSGYICLGHIAIASYSESPDKSKYR